MEADRKGVRGSGTAKLVGQIEHHRRRFWGQEESWEGVIFLGCQPEFGRLCFWECRGFLVFLDGLIVVRIVGAY